MTGGHRPNPPPLLTAALPGELLPVRGFEGNCEKIVVSVKNSDDNCGRVSWLEAQILICESLLRRYERHGRTND